MPCTDTILKMAKKVGVSASWLQGETDVRTPVNRLQSAEWSEIAQGVIDYPKALEKQKIPQGKEP